jgi:hypothetical protein
MEIKQLNDSLLEDWFDHVSQVFSQTGREYFVRHWEKDPYRDIAGLFRMDLIDL